MTHTFLSRGEVGREDLGKLIELTNEGLLSWGHSDNSCALNAYPVAVGAVDTRTASIEAIGDNLRGIRMGYNPSTCQWHYLRLTSHEGHPYYIEEGSPQELMELGDQLYSLAQKALRLGGTLKSSSDEMQFCKTCGKETPHKHLIDSPYGIKEACMAGSERLTCTACETSIPTNTLKDAQRSLA